MTTELSNDEYPSTGDRTDDAIVTTVDIGALEQKKAFLKAFAIAQGAFEPIVKNRNVKIVGKNKNGDRVEYQFRYADMQEIDARTRPALSANGLSTSSPMLAEGKEGAWLSMILSHEDGFERRSEVFVKYGEEPKGFGALCSYMRRYMKTGLLDVTADDDLDENGQDELTGDRDTDTGRAPAPKRMPTRKSEQAATQAAGAAITHGKAADAAAAGLGEPDDGRFAPVDSLVGDVRPTEEETKRQTFERQTAAEAARQKAIETAKIAPAPPPVIDPADNPSTGKPPETVASDKPLEGDSGELCEEGECKYIIKRAKTRGGDDHLAKVLAELGFKLDPKTLKGMLKSQFKQVLPKV